MKPKMIVFRQQDLDQFISSVIMFYPTPSNALLAGRAVERHDTRTNRGRQCLLWLNYFVPIVLNNNHREWVIENTFTLATRT